MSQFSSIDFSTPWLRISNV